MSIIDSNITLLEALREKDIPLEIQTALALLSLSYISFDGEEHTGQLVVHERVADDIEKIFTALHEAAFPIDKIIPVAIYDWDDEDSMQDNNTSAFNYRAILGKMKLSNHALGLAIDINPRINPSVSQDGLVQPSGAVYDIFRAGSVVEGSEVVKLFRSYGWKWGGDWNDPKDWQHFEKPL